MFTEIEPDKKSVELNSSGDENHLLLAKKNKHQSERLPACYVLRRFFGCVISRERRIIKMDGRKTPARFPTNK